MREGSLASWPGFGFHRAFRGRPAPAGRASQPVAGRASLGTAALSGPVADQYLAARCAAGYTAYLTPKALRPLLDYLRGLGVAPKPEQPRPATAAEVLLEAYREYLVGERGVQAVVACGYADLVHPFVAHHAGSPHGQPRLIGRGDVAATVRCAVCGGSAPEPAERLAARVEGLHSRA